MTSIEKAIDFEFESLKSSFMIKILNIFIFFYFMILGVRISL